MTLTSVIQKRTVYGKDGRFSDFVSATGDVRVSGSPGTKTTGLINYQGDQAILTPDISNWETSVRATASTQGTTPSEIIIYAGNAERLRVKSNGNVGVGTSAPGAKFVVNGPASSDNQPEIKVTGNVGSIDIHNSLTTGAWNNIAQVGDKGIIFYDSAESTGNFVIAPWRDSSLVAKGIRMEGSTGDIGIHTINPQRPLHVTGIVRLQGLSTYANNAAAIAGGLAVGDLYIANVSGEGHLRIVI